MSEVFSVVTALTIIAIILLSSGSRLFMQRHFEKQLQPHIEALEKASKKNEKVLVNDS